MAIIMAPDDTVRVISFAKKGIKNKTLEKIADCISYVDTDLSLNEDLYSISGIQDIEKPNKDIKKIIKLCDRHKAAYFRFIS